MNITSTIKKHLIKFLSMGKPKKKIIFESFNFTQYSADPRAISEKMHELFPEYTIVWALKSNVRERNAVLLPDYVKIVDSKMGFIMHLATSVAYVTTEPLTESFYKRKGQFVVQTWHGDRGVKKVLYESAESSGIKREKIYDDIYTDLCISASDFSEERYRKAFKYNGKILKIGMPRNDRLINFNENEYIKIRERFHIPDGYKVLTYAPTFRGHSIMEQNTEINIQRTLDTLEIKGDKWICLLRAHAYSKGILYNGKEDRIIDVSEYPDMSDILVITDMLITDYSSCAGDYALRRKPIILVINDEEEYERSSRSLYFDMKNTGYILSHSQNELDNIITTYSDEDYIDACERALSFYVTTESGKASETICRIINNHCLSMLK